MVKQIPSLSDDKSKCCGCTACFQSCPVSAIEMVTDTEGFTYPKIDPLRCVGCNLCMNVCSFKKDLTDLHGYDHITTHAVIHKDENQRLSSRSGGIFTAVSDYYLNHHGVVYGSITSRDHYVYHMRATDVMQRNQMRGSKYVQSNLGDCFKQVASDLQNGLPVLFTGTPCQIAGLRSYLRKPYDNLLCMDIVCHGVPSASIWDKYIDFQEYKHKSKVIKVDFRNKRDFGWRDHVETLWFENGRKIDSRLYTTLFYSHLIVRPSCFNCPYKSLKREGDITFGDFWGVEQNAPQFDDDKGVSLVMVNTEKGRELFNNVKKDIAFIEVDIDKSMQPPLSGNYEIPSQRQQFWNDEKNGSFHYILKKYAKDKNFYRRNYNKFKKMIKSTLLKTR